MKNQLMTYFAAVTMVALMIGSSFVVSASVPPTENEPADVYTWDFGGHVVTTAETFEDDIIYSQGNITIQSGGVLTLINTTLWMNMNVTWSNFIEVRNGGTLRVLDGGDGFTPMHANDTDASVILANDSALPYNFYVRDGAHFDVDRSAIHNAGAVPVGKDSSLLGGANPDNIASVYCSAPQASFRITINGQTADIKNIVFAYPYAWSLTNMVDVANRIQSSINGLNIPDFDSVVCTWTGTSFNLTSGNEDPFVSSSIEPLTTASSGIDISGETVRPALVYGGDAQFGSPTAFDPNYWYDGTNGVDDGTFRITINGVTKNVGPIKIRSNYQNGTYPYWYCVQNSITDALHAAGFANAYCAKTYGQFFISAGEGGLTSTITNLSKHSGGVGTDISGLTVNAWGHRWLNMADTATICTPGWWMDCADNATAYSYAASDMSKAGIYIRSNFVNIEDSLISENAYALLFDSCLPETLLYNNITDNTGTGLSILNRTTSGYAINYELHDNIFAGNYRAIQFRGQTIGVEVHNLNVSENEFGMEFYANSLLNADIHDNDVWQNYQPYSTGSGSTHGASTIYLLAGPTGTVNAAIERNNIIQNFRGGIWAGYQHGLTPSYNLNLLVANNTILGNDGGEWYHASNILNVKIVDNKLGSSNISGWSWAPGERFRIGYAADESGNPGLLAAPVTNNIEVARNDFLYHDFDKTVYIGGLFKVGGKDSIDMSFVDNDFKAIREDDNTIDIGGMIRAGWVPTGEDTSIVCEEISMDISRNKFLFENRYTTTTDQAINVGGMCTLHAEKNIDVTINDNDVRAISNSGNYINGLSMLRADRTNPETPEELPRDCDHVNVEALRNNFDFRQLYTSSQNIDVGGLFRFAGEFTTTAVFNDNYINMAGYVSIGGLFQAGEIHDLLGKSKSTTVDVFRNTVRYLYADSIGTGPDQGGSFLFNAWNNVDVDFEDNSIFTTYGSGTLLAINNGPSGVNSGSNLANYTTAVVRNNRFICDITDSSSSGIGGIIKMSGNKTLNAIIDNNDIRVNSNDGDIGGVIRLGYPDGRSSDPNPEWNMLDNLIADITNNKILCTMDYQNIGGVIRTFANTSMDMDILNNDITLVDTGDGAQFGHIIAVGFGEYDNGTEAQAEVTNARINGNNINAYYTDSTEGNGVQVRGKVITVEMNDNNLLGYCADTNPYNVLGVRIGYVCENNGILNDYATVSMSNNRIENGGVNAAIHVGALKDIDFSIIGGTVIGAKECATYPLWSTYGNGITLEAVNVTATISGTEFAFNRGAGIFVNASNDADVVISDCNLHDNGWHGAYLAADAGRVTGTITNTDFIDNTGDIYGVIPDPDEYSGLYARNATLSLTNCLFDNPSSLYELELVNATYANALDTYFDRYKALVDADDSTLLVRWTLDVLTIHQASGNPLPGCAVTVRNVTNAIVATGTTGLDGHWKGAIVSEYYRNATAWTNYTAHGFTATKAPASASKTESINKVKTVVLVLNYVSPPPVAEAGDNQTVGQDELVIFNGTASTDDMPPLVSYVWTFNNGTANITLNGDIVNYSFSDMGIYNVTLTVTDIFGDTGSDNMTVTVTDSYPPVANAGADKIVDEDTVVAFNGSASTDSAGITNYTWTFVDGTARILYGATPTYIFAQPGVYTVTLVVSDAAGNTANDTLTVTVLDVTEPVANAGPDQTIPEGGTAFFTATASTDNVLVVAYEWTFNDGTNDIALFGSTPNYTFPSLGSYEVTLVIFDAAGNSGSDIMWVHVVDVTSPNVLLMAPGENLAGVPIDWSLVIVFDEPMNQTSVEAAISISGGINITGFTWDATGRYVTVAFGDFAYNTTYTVTVSVSAKDIAGNPLAAAYTTTFTTMPKPAEPEEPVEPEEPETNFFTNNWWILVVIIVVLAVLLLVSLLRGKKDPAAPATGDVTPAPPAEPAAEPASEPAAEEEIQ